MSSFHIKWSKQVALPMGDRWGEDQGGVASCLNWTRGQKSEPRREPEVPPGTPTLVVKELQLYPGTDRWQAWENPSTDKQQPPISSREKSARDRHVATPVTVARCMNWNYGACAKHATTTPQYSSRQTRTTRNEHTHPNSARKQQKTIIKFRPNLEETGTLRYGNDFKVIHRPPSGKLSKTSNDIYRQQTPIPVNEEDAVEAVKSYTKRQQIKPALATSRNHILNRNYQNQTKPKRSVLFKTMPNPDQYESDDMHEVYITRPVTSFDIQRSDSAMATYRSTTPVMTDRADQPVIAREIWGTENGDVILRGSSMDPLVTDGKFVKIQRPQTCPANGKKGEHFTKWRGKTTALVKAEQNKDLWKHSRLSDYLQPTATTYNYGESAYHRQHPQKGNVKIKLACPPSSDMNVNVRVQSALA